MSEQARPRRPPLEVYTTMGCSARHAARSLPEAAPAGRIVIYEQELEVIGNYIAGSPHQEIGGDLFGLFTHSGFPVVQFVLGPGPACRRGTVSFYQDRDYLIRAGAVLRETHGLQHIGEWHSHHTLGLAEPSGGDVRTVVRAMQSYALARFVLVIGNLANESGRPDAGADPSARAFLFRDRSDCPVPCGWVVLPGASPLLADPRVGSLRSSQGSRGRHPVRSKIHAVPQTSLDAPPKTVAPPLRPGYWATTQSGVATLSTILGSLGKLASPRMTPSPDGLLEVRLLTRSEGEWVATFAEKVSAEHAEVELRRDDDAAIPAVQLSGSLADVLSSLALAVETEAAPCAPAATPAQLVPQGPRVEESTPAPAALVPQPLRTPAAAERRAQPSLRQRLLATAASPLRVLASAVALPVRSVAWCASLLSIRTHVDEE